MFSPENGESGCGACSNSYAYVPCPFEIGWSLRDDHVLCTRDRKCQNAETVEEGGRPSRCVVRACVYAVARFCTMRHIRIEDPKDTCMFLGDTP